MQKKLIRYTVSILLLGFVAYHSVYFKKLDEVRSGLANKFDASAYARNFFDKQLPAKVDSAVDLQQLLTLLHATPTTAFNQYSHALGIGNVRYFLVKGEGTIQSLTGDALKIAMEPDSLSTPVKIATEFVYGNAIRDASGLVNLNEFNSTADFNSVSEEINKIVRNKVLPAFKTSAATGKKMSFAGAIELNQAHLKLDSIEVIPIRLSFQK